MRDRAALPASEPSSASSAPRRHRSSSSTRRSRLASSPAGAAARTSTSRVRRGQALARPNDTASCAPTGHSCGASPSSWPLDCAALESKTRIAPRREGGDPTVVARKRALALPGPLRLTTHRDARRRSAGRCRRSWVHAVARARAPRRGPRGCGGRRARPPAQAQFPHAVALRRCPMK